MAAKREGSASPLETREERRNRGCTSPANQRGSHSAKISRHEPEWGQPAFHELGQQIFESFARSDQRRHGMDYLEGLLRAHGRRSIRNIAAMFDDSAAPQRLHHFISNSTWEWSPVRRALGRYVVERMRPTVWVVRPKVIPKWGENAIGADRQYAPQYGQVINAQQTVGIWAATESTSSPVNWRLQLSEAWLEQPTRRSQAAIPRDVTICDLTASVIDAASETGSHWGLPVMPVVMDARQVDVSLLVRGLRKAGLPFMVRVSKNLLLAETAQAPRRARADNVQAADQLMLGAWGRVRPVVWKSASAPRTELTATAEVAVCRAAEQLVLLGIGRPRERWPGELWLTDMTSVHVADLVRISRLPNRIDQDCSEGADRLGILDFGGRTYKGWHRHVTLVSAAHTVSVMRSCRER
ncbi:IS701 family transposase [Streptomyces sp. NPDC056480]|uniref:IS701 family transposase n=1 Tax=Streptomyces sp. NPDC056480 TaxID=3345833 RepID=UPI00367DE2A5